MTITIPLTKGYSAVIDDCDASLVLAHKWHAITSTIGILDRVYAATNLPRNSGRPRQLLMHRLIMSEPVGMDVDHRNHDGLVNCRFNLRVATRAQNLGNRRAGANPHGFRGVVCLKGRFYGRITLNKKDIYTKQCADAVSAAHAWDELARETWGEFAFQNFPISQHETASSLVSGTV
jgi:hypothetical protein